MPDGSTFQTRPVYQKNGIDEKAFVYTSVTAVVEGKAYAGRIDIHSDDLEMSDLCTQLTQVPVANIFPDYPDCFTMAPEYDARQHYLKSPSFGFEDLEYGRTFVASMLLNEASRYEERKALSHPHIAEYLGGVVEQGRIRKICLRRYEQSLAEYLKHHGISDEKAESILLQVVSAVRHLHKVGYAHNDVNVWNICMDAAQQAVLIDFDACQEFGTPLLKGVGRMLDEDGVIVSSAMNDWDALGELDACLRSAVNEAVDR